MKKESLIINFMCLVLIRNKCKIVLLKEILRKKLKAVHYRKNISII